MKTNNPKELPLEDEGSGKDEILFVREEAVPEASRRRKEEERPKEVEYRFSGGILHIQRGVREHEFDIKSIDQCYQASHLVGEIITDLVGKHGEVDFLVQSLQKLRENLDERCFELRRKKKPFGDISSGGAGPPPENL